MNFLSSLKNIKSFLLYDINLPTKNKIIAKKSVKKLINFWNKNADLKKESIEAYKNYFGGDFIDVGCHQGSYLFFLASKAKKHDKFICIEPNIDNQSTLFDTITLLSQIYNKIKFINLPYAVSNKKKISEIQTNYGHSTFKSTSKSNLFALTGDEIVKFHNLKPTFIKIDTEGAEKEVLQSFKKTLKKFKPRIILEKHPTLVKSKTFLEIDNFLKRNNYRKKNIYSNNLAVSELWK